MKFSFGTKGLFLGDMRSFLGRGNGSKKCQLLSIHKLRPPNKCSLIYCILYRYTATCSVFAARIYSQFFYTTPNQNELAQSSMDISSNDFKPTKRFFLKKKGPQSDSVKYQSLIERTRISWINQVLCQLPT